MVDCNEELMLGKPIEHNLQNTWVEQTVEVIKQHGNLGLVTVERLRKGNTIYMVGDVSVQNNKKQHMCRPYTQISPKTETKIE